MSSVERLEQFQYESPKKKLFTLNFDTLTRSGGKKVGINEFPDRNVTNEQELGNIANRFPVECYFSGENHDQEADRFFRALEENGIGTLDHPRWGSHDVIPLTYEQKEDWVNGIARSTFTIEFIKYYPEAEGFFAFLNAAFDFAELILDAANRILSLQTAALRLQRGIAQRIGATQLEFNRVKSRATNVLESFTRQEKNFGIRVQELKDRINKEKRQIERNIDDLVKEPAQLVTNLNSLFQLSTSTISSIEAKVSGYKNLLEFTGLQLNTPNAIYNPNEATLQGCIASISTSALLASSLEGDIATRSQAVRIADLIYDSVQNLKTIFDRVEALNGIADYDVYYHFRRFASQCQKILIDRTLRLPTERIVTLTKNITPVVFCYEFLDDINRVDEFITYNNLQDMEIILMPEGKQVRFIP